MIELKRCPFCGGEAKMEVLHKMANTHGVFCMTCKAQSWQFFCTEDDAAAAWNQRVTDEMEDDLK